MQQNTACLQCEEDVMMVSEFQRISLAVVEEHGGDMYCDGGASS